MSKEGRPQVSVVIPTFNRAGALVETVRSVLASDLDRDVRLEVIVVDDGSSVPASEALADVQAGGPGRSLRVIRQQNQGVGGARNRGFREAAGDLVVFVDDDMLLFPETLRGHLDAHRRCPGAVIFGRSPYVSQAEVNPFVRWVLDLGNDRSTPADELVPARIIASGHLSVERTGPVARWGRVYAQDMRTPVAEEYELSHRLIAHRIPVYMAPAITAFHNRKIDVDSFLRQQQGHGRGCAEAALLHPECLELDELRGIIRHHRQRSARQALWVILGTKPARSMLHLAAQKGERGRLGPLSPHVFRLSAGAWFSAGIRAVERA